jgi:cob(I)alamin adenosyltransferase
MKKISLYTRKGDDGTTSLVGGVRIMKTDARLEAYGTVDELSSQLGMLVTCIDDDQDKVIVERIQNNLFVICSYLATDQSRTDLLPASKLDSKEVKIIEDAIDKIDEFLPSQTSFILPGGVRAAAQAHICRTVCRRAERRILSLGETVEISSEVLAYMNRISDYMYILSRKLNFIANRDEKTWQKTCK